MILRPVFLCSASVLHAVFFWSHADDFAEYFSKMALRAEGESGTDLHYGQVSSFYQTACFSNFAFLYVSSEGVPGFCVENL